MSSGTATATAGVGATCMATGSTGPVTNVTASPRAGSIASAAFTASAIRLRSSAGGAIGVCTCTASGKDRSPPSHVTGPSATIRTVTRCARPGSTAAARAAGRRLAAAVVAALVDTPGGGVDLDVFFDGLLVRVGVVDPETVDFTIRRSWYDEPIDLRRDAVINVLFVVSVGPESRAQRVAPYVLFTKRQRGIRWIDSTPRSLDG